MRPILFEIPILGGIPIYSYGVMLGLSLILGWYLALALAARDGLSKERMGSCYVWTAVWAVIGSRLLYVITNFENFHAPRGSLLDIVMVNKGGLVAYGGFLGGFFASWFYCKRHRISLLLWADSAVVAIALGTAVTRVGCLMFGCDFGAPTSLPWGIRFGRNVIRGTLQNTPALAKHISEGLVPRDATLSLPVHPTQIYESVAGLFLVGLLLLVRKYFRRFTGQIFLTWVMGYGVLRYLIELVRDDPERGGIQLGSSAGWPSYWSESQVIAFVTSVLAAVGFAFLWRRAQQNPAAARTWEANEPEDTGEKAADKGEKKGHSGRAGKNKHEEKETRKRSGCLRA